MENRYAMKNLVNVIEVFVSLVIMFSMVFLTLLSTETASVKIQPKHQQQHKTTATPDSIVDLRVQ
jgi:hypothetical protein